MGKLNCKTLEDQILILKIQLITELIKRAALYITSNENNL